MYDILMSVKQDLTEKEYMEMATNKTARLIAAAIEVGALLGNATLEQKNALKGYGMLAALSFQIQDDIMDVSATMKKGRALGSDIKKGKRTLLMINALNKANKKQKDI